MDLQTVRDYFNINSSLDMIDFSQYIMLGGKISITKSSDMTSLAINLQI